MLIGLRFVQSFGDYAIYLEMTPLWIENENFSINPIFDDAVDANIPIQWNDAYFHKAVASAKLQFGDLLKDTILLDSIFSVVDKRIQYAGFSYNIFMLREILRVKLAYAIYFDNQQMIESINALITKKAKSWNCGCTSLPRIGSVGNWLDEFFSEFNDRERFMKAIEENLTLPKIARLNSARVINNPDLRVASPTKFETLVNRLKSKFRHQTNSF